MPNQEPLGESLVNVDRAYQTAWIAYINGIECPALSVSISYGVWLIPECELTMIPDPVLQRLGAEDRVTVQIFYCDYWMNPENPEFRIMFDGEIVSWNYVSVQRGRALSFTAIDYIQIFTQLFFFFMSNVDDMAVGMGNEEIGVGINTVNTPGYGALYPYSLFSEGLISANKGGAGGPSAATIKRPIDFVYNIVRGLIQADAPNRSIPAANFFAPWTQRTNFHRRFIALPMLERSDTTDAGLFPILRAVQADFAISAVARLASSVGSSGSMWNMLQQILQTMMMEINMLPTPSAISIDKYPTDDSTGLVPNGPPANRSEGVHPTILTNYFVKPQFLFGIPPSCNVFYPSQVVHFAYEENYITQPTRMYFNEESWTTYLNTAASSTPGLQSLIRDALAVAHPEEVHLAARNAVEHPGENGKNLLVYPEEFYKGPVVDRRPMPRWFTFLEQSQQGGTTNGPEGQPAPDPTPPSPTPEDSDTASTDVPPGDEDRNVYRLYAKYEFFKEKYARRTGGLQLVFNPYPVPGFPCAIFDSRATQVDVFGYIMNVRQNMHSKGWSTQVSFSYGRTFQEVFAAMNKQFALENETINQQRAVTATAVTENTRERLANNGERVGAVAMAPPEPISEIRDVIQNFTRAESFYRSLFFRIASPDAAVLDRDQLRAAADRDTMAAQARVDAVNAGRPTSNPDAPNASEEPPIQIVEPPSTTAEGMSPSKREALAARDIEGKRAAFFYPEIIEFQDDQGYRTGIRLEGIDTSARSRLISTVAAMRNGTATEEDLAFVREATGRDYFVQQTEGEDLNPNITATLNSLELNVRNTQINTNITGDQTIVPRREAQPLFDSYDAAMRSASRPICTLDEYVGFLGDAGVREGAVTKETALLQGDPRTFPATYYTRIRYYRPGPPASVPRTDITNSAVITGADGVTPVEGQQEAREKGAKTADAAAGAEASTTNENVGGQVQGLPDDFPQTRANWDTILLAYRVNALVKLAPRT